MITNFNYETASQFVITQHSIMLLLKNNGTNGNNLNLNNNGMLHNHNNGMLHNPNGMHHNPNNGLPNHNNGTQLQNLNNGMHQPHKHQAVVTNTQQEFLHNLAQIILTVMFLEPLDQQDHHVLPHSKDLLKDYTQQEFQHNLVQTTQNANFSNIFYKPSRSPTFNQHLQLILNPLT